MKYKTNGNMNPQGMPKVYFTGHPKDCKVYFENISSTILKLHNCAVFYDENPDKPDDEENFITNLERMQLVVMILTRRFLYSDTFAQNVVFKHAVKADIPVLPILEESGIEKEFNDRCGNLQCLDPNARDSTQLSFEEKLRKYLDSIFIKDELIEKIRQSFIGHIFLSYRKKDRKYAQELMKLIHSYEFCRDIAIWYDEFLIPGEKFDEAIQKAMTNSDLVTISVTPSLLEESNYVMEHEYPDARALKLPIIPVVLSPIDREALKENYENIPEPIDSFDTETLAAELRNVLENSVNLEIKNDPKHVFLIGLAYLSGIDVEIDRERGAEMITYAAEHNLVEAIKKLVGMYRSGEGVEQNYEKAIDWQKRLVDLLEKLFTKEQTEHNASNFIDSLWDLGDFTLELGHNSEAGLIYQKMLTVSEQAHALFNEIWTEEEIAISHGSLGKVYKNKGDLNATKYHFEKSLDIYEHLTKQTDSVIVQRNLSVIYDNFGGIFQEQGDLDYANVYYEKALAIRKCLAEQVDSVERDLAISYDNLGGICQAQGDLNGAKVYYEKAFAIRESLAEQIDSVETQRDLSVSYNKLGRIYQEQGDLDGAKGYYEKALVIDEHLAEQVDSVGAQRDLSVSHDNLGEICQAQGDLNGAKVYYEKALAIRECLAEQIDSVETQRDLSASYNKIGEIYQEQGDLDGAKGYYEKALVIDERLAEQVDSVKTHRDLSVSYYNLGRICQKQGGLNGAKFYYEKALTIRECLAGQVNSVEMQRDLSISYESLGRICQEQGDLDGAKVNYKKALAISECLADQVDSVETQRDLSNIYNDLGRICQEQGDLNGAKVYYEKNLAISKCLAD